jgi:hypothetical protein
VSQLKIPLLHVQERKEDLYRPQENGSTFFPGNQYA